MADPSRSDKRFSQIFRSTPSGRRFALLLTLSSMAVVLAVYFAFRGANDVPLESPATEIPTGP